MHIRTDWLICVTTTSDDDDINTPFVEIEDIGIPEADEIRLRTGNGVSRIIEDNGRPYECYNREGLRLLREAIDAYLKAAKQRDEEEA